MEYARGCATELAVGQATTISDKRGRECVIPS